MARSNESSETESSPPEGRDEYDVVVVGGGTAGAAAAWQFAAAGRRAALVEAQALDSAGATWVNAIPPWQFDAAGLARPTPPELRESAPCLHVFGPSARRRVVVAPPPGWPVDMRRLVARVQGLARGAGATLLPGLRLEGVTLEGDRPVAVRVVPTTGGPERTLRARLFVDATGLRGALLRRVPRLARACPPLPAGDLCVAAQEVAAVNDRAAARAFLQRHGAELGGALDWTGVAGGFSVLQVHVSEDLDEVDLLTGVVASGRHPTALDLLREFRLKNPWVGDRLFGGGGHIPLRRPYARLAAPGIALVGNAACQVFPAHASGIGAGLVAARLLAESTLAADPGDPGSARAVWAYQAAFHRGVGATHHAYDLFRRVTQALTPAETDALFESGLVTTAGSRAALAQQLPPATPGEALALARAALRAPRLALKLGRALGRMPAVVAWCRGYPERPSERDLRLWTRGLARLLGVSADPV